MPSSRRLVLTREAESDLADIWQYTAEVWGERQADTYTTMIRAKLEGLCAFPDIGRSRDDLAPRLRSHPVGQHVAYFRVTEHEVIVRRLFHSRRDIDDEFDP